MKKIEDRAKNFRNYELLSIELSTESSNNNQVGTYLNGRQLIIKLIRCSRNEDNNNSCLLSMAKTE